VEPECQYPIRVLAVAGETVYAGGSFTSIGGQERNRIAALDAATGAATLWNPDADGSVEAIAVSGETVYVGGNFGTIGGRTRHYIAALDVATGAANSWDPSANGSVQILAASGGTIYAGGGFYEHRRPGEKLRRCHRCHDRAGHFLGS